MAKFSQLSADKARHYRRAITHQAGQRKKQRKAVSDPVLAKCCREVYATPRKKPPGTGLLLVTVPRILIGGKLNYV